MHTSKEMKIAFLGYLPANSVFPPDVLRSSAQGIGHPAPWMAALLPALAATTDFNMRAFLPQRAMLKRAVVERDGVEYEGLPVGFTERWNPQTNYLVRSAAVHRALLEYKPDLIHAFGIESGNATVALRTGLPVSCFIQGIVERYYPYIAYTGRCRRFCQRVIERRAIRQLKWLVAETEFAREWAREWNPEAYVKIVPHPTRRAFLDSPTATGSKHVVSVGGVDTRKAMDVAVRAFSRIGDRDSRMTIVGGGSGFASLRALVQSLGLSERVRLVGSVSSDEVLEVLLSASVFLITSRVDTSPNVLSEAHAVGLPVVGTRGGGIPEMIEDGIDGYVCDVDDVDALAARLRELLMNPEKALEMGMKGRRKVAVENDPERVAQAHVEFFQKVQRDLRAK